MTNAYSRRNLDAIRKATIRFNDDKSVTFWGGRFQAQGSQSSQPHANAQDLSWAQMAMPGRRFFQ
jgi:hypothetical protein